MVQSERNIQSTTPRVFRVRDASNPSGVSSFGREDDGGCGEVGFIGDEHGSTGICRDTNTFDDLTEGREGFRVGIWAV